jgi:hypothetical protein
VAAGGNRDALKHHVDTADWHDVAVDPGPPSWILRFTEHEVATVVGRNVDRHSRVLDRDEMRAPRTRRERLRSDAGFDEDAPHRIERPTIRKLRIADRVDGSIVGQLLSSRCHPHARHCAEVLVDDVAFFARPFFVRAAIGTSRRTVRRHLPPAVGVRQQQ